MVKEKKQKKFQPAKTFRYLKGDVSKHINNLDLKMYNTHKLHVHQASPQVDTKPLPLHPTKWLNARKLLDAKFNALKVAKENARLVAKIDFIHRTKGSVDTYNPIAYKRYNQWKHHEEEMQKIEKYNKKIHKRLVQAPTHYPTNEFLQKWDNNITQLKHSCRFPLVLVKQPKIDDLDIVVQKYPSISEGLNGDNSKRDICFLDFQVVNGEYLGRIYVELYNDYVPATVLNFMSMIRGEGELDYKNCPVHAIIKDRYLETGDIVYGTGRGGRCIYGNTFAEENHVLKHTRPGVLSMKRIVPKSFPQFPTENHSQFCITFAPMCQLDQKNVVFGKVIKGNRNLFKIQDYGRTIGKPYADIMISNCGEASREQINQLIAKNLYKVGQYPSGVTYNSAASMKEGTKGEVGKIKSCNCQKCQLFHFLV